MKKSTDFNPGKRYHSIDQMNEEFQRLQLNKFKNKDQTFKNNALQLFNESKKTLTLKRLFYSIIALAAIGTPYSVYYQENKFQPFLTAFVFLMLTFYIKLIANFELKRVIDYGLLFIKIMACYLISALMLDFVMTVV